VVVEYKFSNLKHLNSGSSLKKNLKRKVVKHHRKRDPTRFEIDNIEGATIAYIRHIHTDYEKGLSLTESEDEYVMLKLMTLAHIGSSFEFLSKQACDSMAKLLKGRLRGRKSCSKKHYTWWGKVKRVIRVMFGRK